MGIKEEYAGRPSRKFFRRPYKFSLVQINRAKPEKIAALVRHSSEGGWNLPVEHLRHFLNFPEGDNACQSLYRTLQTHHGWVANYSHANPHIISKCETCTLAPPRSVDGWGSGVMTCFFECSCGVRLA
jgi:hypothetical protein